ncbi:MAG: alkaline phosphatase [Fuerstiella sp.]
MVRLLNLMVACACGVASLLSESSAGDPVAELQSAAMATGRSGLGHWGTDPEKYSDWKTHSNRLVPVYTFGTGHADGALNLNHYTGPNSPYRSAEAVKRLYGRLPERTVTETAVWMDQTNIADLQTAAAAAGRQYIFLVVFDGMDWETTRAAAIYNQKSVGYRKGKGAGTHFQNYDAGGTAQFAFMVTSPHNDGTDTDVDLQTVTNPGGTVFGGYDPAAGGFAPWDMPADLGYLIAKPSEGLVRHAYTDSASSATSMTAGIKTYNNAINVSSRGEQVATIAHDLQDQGWAVGAVSSVPISHATPACAYAHNVTRQDYQDISRDLLGLPSVAHPDHPLTGLDVIVGGGFGTTADDGESQGSNFEPGSVYMADSDLEKVSVANGGKYVTAVRTPGRSGKEVLANAAAIAAESGDRLLGFFGVGQYNGHLPFQTANADYQPVRGVAKKAEAYSQADILENPTLADMTVAALDVLQSRDSNFWLMVEAGDVDWANHDNNLDNSIGAVNSGDAAVRVITDWVEANSNWEESMLIVTADHGHLLMLTAPELLAADSASDTVDDSRQTDVEESE